MRRIRLNIIKPVLLGGNIMVPMNEKDKTKYYKTCITRWEYNGSYKEKDMTKYYKTCITRWEYNGSYE